MTAARRIVLGDDAATWAALGFAVAPGGCRVGALELALTGEGGGVRCLEVDALPPGADLAGLPLAEGPPPRGVLPAAHPNGAVRVDHVVVVAPDRDVAVWALESAGGDLRRTGGPPELPARMAFLRLGPLVVEVAERPGQAGPHFWGLTIEVADLDALAGDRLGPVRAAVQPGRRIATVRPEAGTTAAVALMDRRGA